MFVFLGNFYEKKIKTSTTQSDCFDKAALVPIDEKEKSASRTINTFLCEKNISANITEIKLLLMRHILTVKYKQ